MSAARAMSVRLLALSASCLVLAALVAITGERRGGVARPLVAPGLDAHQVSMLVLMRPGAPDIPIALGDGGAQVLAPAPGPADEVVVRDLISAIAAARADRVAGAAAWRRAHLDTPRITVRIDRKGAPSIEVRVGDAQPASHQVWLGVGERALLVPAWVGDALDRELPALRVRRPFASAAITGVELHAAPAIWLAGAPATQIDLVLAGDPPLRRDAGTSVRLAAAARDRLYDALHAIELDVLVAAPPALESMSVRVMGGAATAELHAYNACPGHADHVYVDGSAGAGCVPAAALVELRAAAALAAGPDGVARAPLEREPASITAGDTALERRGAAWQVRRGDQRWPADDDAVNALLVALARSAPKLAPAPPAAPSATWTVDLGGGTVETWQLHRIGADVFLVRGGEAQALVLDRDAARAIAGFGADLRSKTLLAIEPTSIAAITATGASPATLTRGSGIL